MIPYKKHLIIRKSSGEKIDITKKPIFRSSAIFPVINNKYIKSNITFLGYWLLKRKIPEVTLLTTLRDQKGKIIKRRSLLINKIKSFKIQISKMLDKQDLQFVGSIELEIFSSRDMVFSFPAFVLNYVSINSSTFVHTCGRIYNDFEDLNLNSEIKVPESGFDIIPNKNFFPYFAFVNGPQNIKKNKIKLEIINYKGKTFKKEIYFNYISALETKFVFFLNESEKKFLNGKKGTVKIKHNLSGFFPRFICGNMKKNQSIVSLTHTYYDTSENNKNSYWINPDKKNLFDSIITFPIFYRKKEYTDLVLYPIYPKSNLKFDLEIYNNEGKCLDKVKSIFNIKNKLIFPANIEIKKFLNKDILKRNSFLFAKIIVNGDGKLPSRLKFGLNIGKPKKFDVPSNVCFNAQVPNKEIFNKTGTFKWCPILNHKSSLIVLSNFSYAKNGYKNSKVDIKIWREKDYKFLEKKIVINDNGSYTFDIKKNKDIKSFLSKDACWITFKSNNPFLNGYYIEDLGSGVIGADHLF